MSQELKHNHAGHRQRLKDKVRKTRLTTLAEHEIIELLLTYTIPRKDTNPIAHELLKTFSSIDRVIDANVRDLQKVNGVGEETALFFKILSQLFGVYKQSKENYKDKLLTTQQSIEYFRKRHEILADEYMVVVCLSKAGVVNSTFYIYGDCEDEIRIDIKTFADKINQKNTSSIVVFHTHPEGEIEPSMADLKTTQDIFNICSVMKIKLADHIIVNETEHFSFAGKGLIEQMERNYNRNYPNYTKLILNRQEEEDK